MHGHEATRAQDLVRVDGFFGIHVLGLHEPARRIGANGQDGDVNARKTLADGLEHWWVQGAVASEVDSESVTLINEAAPQCAVPTG